jgi:hypothetical protein
MALMFANSGLCYARRYLVFTRLPTAGVTIAGLTDRFNGPTTVYGELGSSRGATVCGDDATPNNPEPRHNKLVRSNIRGHARNTDDRQP